MPQSSAGQPGLTIVTSAPQLGPLSSLLYRRPMRGIMVCLILRQATTISLLLCTSSSCSFHSLCSSCNALWVCLRESSSLRALTNSWFPPVKSSFSCAITPAHGSCKARSLDIWSRRGLAMPFSSLFSLVSWSMMPGHCPWAECSWRACRSKAAIFAAHPACKPEVYLNDLSSALNLFSQPTCLLRKSLSFSTNSSNSSLRLAKAFSKSAIMLGHSLCAFHSSSLSLRSFVFCMSVSSRRFTTSSSFCLTEDRSLAIVAGQSLCCLRRSRRSECSCEILS
mmetsp:Transcript_19382/g.38381  ORF Transcript_19382/g.38381 Transcript_19382/m.38381 type:complete len:280 (-) Transcript_19382:349-1188(-)